ncbi:ATP-binding cassette domain-containing protein [Corallococcus sp. BB11-1]|nr:ATP-binding cassette domain-containing protein [Corallococcus sp. BB11-1]MCY1033471.1 ATP-binding cassette domain-containing protein [Corallococcus sp. BB11-1]
MLRDVRKQYGSQAVIHGVSLELGHRELIVFVGPSGCGKSTLLRMIAGLEQLGGGESLIGGRRVNETPAGERGIAVVFQNRALYPHMTAADNMALGLRDFGTPRAEINERVATAAKTLQGDAALPGVAAIPRARPPHLPRGRCAHDALDSFTRRRRTPTLSWRSRTTPVSRRVARLCGNVRQPDDVLVHLLAGLKAESRPRAGEEGLAGTKHDWVQVDSILINETEVRQASRQLRAYNVKLSIKLRLQLADRRLDVVRDKGGVGADGLQRA